MIDLPTTQKILFISTKSVFGGAQRYIVDLVDHLPKDEFEILVAAGGKGILATKMAERKIPYYDIRGLDRDVNVWKDIMSFFRLLALIERLKPDIIHLNGSKISIVGAIAGRLAGTKKIISTTHGWPFLEQRSSLQQMLLRILARIGSLFQDRIICVSTFDYMMGIQYHIAPKKKLVRIHNGIDARHRMFLDREKARDAIFTHEHIPRKNHFIVGTVGEYTKNKGLQYIIESAPHILDMAPHALFFLIGWGEQKDTLRAHIQKHDLEKSVFLVDYLPEASSYMKIFDIFILPSVKEGFAYTLLEASLAELPIIATRVGGNPEIIENFKTGILIAPASPDEIINAVRHLMQNKPHAACLGATARTYVERTYPLERMVQETLSVYRD